MSTSILVLFGLLHIKHFISDFPLQTVYMLGKGKQGFAWILPLAAHCSVHMVMSALIILCFNPRMVWVAGIEFFAHFVIDRVKVTYKLPTGQWDAQDRGKYLAKYYTAFGLDQLAHQLTYVLMVYWIAS